MQIDGSAISSTKKTRVKNKQDALCASEDAAKFDGGDYAHIQRTPSPTMT